MLILPVVCIICQFRIQADIKNNVLRYHCPQHRDGKQLLGASPKLVILASQILHTDIIILRQIFDELEILL